MSEEKLYVISLIWQVMDEEPEEKDAYVPAPTPELALKKVREAFPLATVESVWLIKDAVLVL